MEKPVVQNLRSDIDYLLDLNVTFHKNFTYGKSSWAQWGEYQNWINFNILSLRTIKNLSSQMLYRESFILIRSVFEAYFIIKLSMLAKNVYFNFLPYKNESKDVLEARARKEAEKAFGKENIKRIKLIEKGKCSYTVEVIYKLKPIGDSEKIVPRHYFFFKEFDPEYCYLSEVRFNDEYGAIDRKGNNKTLHKNINRMFISMPNAILKFLDINRMATKRQRDAILVHYNFLSQFAHGSAKSYDISSNNCEKAYLENLSQVASQDDHKELLILLYICHIAIYFIELQVEYFSGEKEIKISSVHDVLEVVEEVKRKYSFFWFIYNQPSEFDIYQYKINKICKNKNLTIKSHRDVPYYRNPLKRLRDMGGYWENQILGEYKPPVLMRDI